jgi:hypothetical protein
MWFIGRNDMLSTSYLRLTRYAIGPAILLTISAMLACSATITVDPDSPAPRPTVMVNSLRLTFIGQDGESHAGRLCASGTANDNVHLRLDGLRTDVEAVAFRVDEPAEGGVWATPCNPVSNWLLYVVPGVDGRSDLYFKPFRDAPDGTEYVVTVQYSDGQVQRASVIGSRVKP